MITYIVDEKYYEQKIHLKVKLNSFESFAPFNGFLREDDAIADKKNAKTVAKLNSLVFIEIGLLSIQRIMQPSTDQWFLLIF